MRISCGPTNKYFPHKTLSSCTKFLPEQLKLEGRWQVAFSEISYPSMYQNLREGNFMFFDKKRSKSSEFLYLEPGLYPSITDIVEAMNILIQERHNHSENFIKVKVSRRTQIVEIYLANKGSGLACFSTDLGRIFDSNVGNEFGVMLRGKGPHKPQIAYDIVRIHSLMMYTDLIEYNIVGDTKAPLLRCFPFISKLKSGDIITTGQYINYQTFSNLQFRPFLNFSFIVRASIWETRAVKKDLCICRYHSPCFDVQRSLQHSFLTWKTLQDGFFKTSRDSIL